MADDVVPDRLADDENRNLAAECRRQASMSDEAERHLWNAVADELGQKWDEVAHARVGYRNQVDELLAEVERLRADKEICYQAWKKQYGEIGRLRDAFEDMTAMWQESEDKRDRLRAEIERLSAH